MFQDTLLIIKPDYLLKRKAILLYLLQHGFFIKGQRKVCFTPELAAEFYTDRTEDASFMFQVILLSKGNSEAFILAKECAVQDLIHLMVCYFGNFHELEKNVHVTPCFNKVQREISFIFPNYIHEPIYGPEQVKFCANNRLVETTISSLYNIVTNPEKDTRKNWKEKLAESLILGSETLPHISNKCSQNVRLNAQDIAQQTCLKYENGFENILELKSLPSDLSRDCSSLNATTSSCVSCSGFNSGAECVKQTLEQIIKARTAPLSAGCPSSGSSAQESIWGGLDIEEPLVSVEKREDAAINDLGVKNNNDQHMPDNETSNVEYIQTHHRENEQLIEDITTKFEESTLPFVDEKEENINEPEEFVAMAYNVTSDEESTQLSNRENNLSVEKITMLPVAEQNIDISEEILPFSAEVTAEEIIKFDD